MHGFSKIFLQLKKFFLSIDAPANNSCDLFYYGQRYFLCIGKKLLIASSPKFLTLAKQSGNIKATCDYDLSALYGKQSIRLLFLQRALFYDPFHNEENKNTGNKH